MSSQSRPLSSHSGRTSVPSTFLVVVLVIAVGVADEEDDSFALRVAASRRRARRRAVGITVGGSLGILTVKPEISARAVAIGEVAILPVADDTVRQRGRRSQNEERAGYASKWGFPILLFYVCSGDAGKRQDRTVVKTEEGLDGRSCPKLNYCGVSRKVAPPP